MQAMQEIKTSYGKTIQSKLFETGQLVEHNGQRARVVRHVAMNAYEGAQPTGWVVLADLRRGEQFEVWANYCNAVA